MGQIYFGVIEPGWVKIQSALTRQQFIWSRSVSDNTVMINGRILNALLDGFDVWSQGHRELAIRRVG